MQQGTAQKTVFANCALSVFLLAVFSVFTADDSYILLRYADNFIQHGEISFNISEKVSAITSPLHFILTVLLVQVSGTHILLTGKILMCVLLFASAFMIARPFKAQPMVYILPFITLLLSPFVIMWTVGGLETTLLLFLITWLCISSIKNATPKQLYLLCLISGLAFTTRFDSVLFTAPFLLIYFFLQRRTIGTVRIAFKAAFLYAIIPAVWLGFALFYFHDPLPTSFYLKIIRSLSLDTVIYCLQFFVYSGFTPFYALAIFLLYKHDNLAYLKTHFSKFGHIHLALLFITLYGFANAQVHMMFGYRLLIPYSGALVLILLYIFYEIYSKYNGKAFFGRNIYAALLILFGCFQLLHCGYVYYRSVNGMTLSGEYRQLSIYSYKHHFLKVMEDGAMDLEKHIRSQSKFIDTPATFVTFAEGVIPYKIPYLYTYGQLVSLRKNDVEYSYDFIKHSDYFYLVSHLQQSFLDDVLQAGDKYQVISRRSIPFNGRQVTFYIFFNPNPQYRQLTKYVRNKPGDFFTKTLNYLTTNKTEHQGITK